MVEKKQVDMQKFGEWALKLATSKLNQEETLEMKKLIFNDLSPSIRELEISQIQEVMSFLENAAAVLLTTKSVCDIVRKEKLDQLPKERQEKLAKEWEEIQSKRAKSGVQQTKEKDPKFVEKKEKTEEAKKTRKVAAERLSASEKAIKALTKLGISETEAKKRLGLA